MLKRGLLLFMAILLVLVSSSCYQNLSDVPDEQGEKEDTLRVLHFSVGDDWSVLPRSIEYFEDPSLKLEINQVDSEDEAAYDQLQMEIISGNTPDILLDANALYPCNGRLLFGLLQQDAFLELQPYLNDWEELEELTLYPSITNCINTDGTCLLLPMAQFMPTLATTSERMEQYGIELDQNSTVKEFKDQMEHYLSKNPDGLIFPQCMMFNEFLRLTGASSIFVDRQNKTSSFDSEEFRMLVECYELISQHQGEEVVYSNNNEYVCVEMFLQNEALFMFRVEVNMFMFTAAYETILKEEAGEQLKLYGFPMVEEGTYLSRYSSVSGVLKGTPLPDQSVALLFNWFEYHTSRRKSLYLSRSMTEKEKASALLGLGEPLSGYSMLNPSPVSPELADNIMELLDTVTQGYLSDKEIVDAFIVPCMEPYFDKSQAMDQCIETLQNKVRLYLSE